MVLMHKNLREVKHWAAFFSDDVDTQVGAKIVRNGVDVASGANVIPGDVNKTVVRSTRPEKYAWIQHAEQNAIANAAKAGVATEGARMYCTLFPCNVCAQAIITAGIVRVVCPEPDMTRDSASHYTEALEMFKEAGVEVLYGEV